MWMKVIGDKAEVKFLLLFDLEGPEMLKRLLYRASQSEVKRDDDKEEVMKKRIETFEKSQKAVNLRRDPRIACLLESGTEYAELKGVQINGDAQLVTDPAEVTELMKAVLRRNHEMDEAMLEMAAAQGSKKRIGAIVEPSKIVSWDHTKLDVSY